MRSAGPPITSVPQTLVQEDGEMGGPDLESEPVYLWPPGALLLVWDNKSWWEEPWPGSKGLEFWALL